MNGRIIRAAGMGHAAAAQKFSGHMPGFPPGQTVYRGSFCKSCCHPASKCCCSSRECMKEAKELLVSPVTKLGTTGTTGTIDNNLIKDRMAAFFINPQSPEKAGDTGSPLSMATNVTGLAAGLAAGTIAAGTGDAIIGGGCCVHLSIEYMQNIELTPTPAGTVAAIIVMVIDSENTMLAWAKTNIPAGYHIKEGIISTNPGAKVMVTVINAIARVRWCEVFSC